MDATSVAIKKQQQQEAQYCIPYHYIPQVDDACFSQTLFWVWGANYLAGIKKVLSYLEKLKFESIIDVGCGDGRFLREVVSCYPQAKVKGIDYSSKAISLAKAMNPNIDFDCIDIAQKTNIGKFHVVTLLEVLEHIPPSNIDDFLRGIAKIMSKKSILIITVPHTNVNLVKKHFQHFSSDSIRHILSPWFQIENIIPFDRNSTFIRRFMRLLGYSGNNYIITNKRLNKFLYQKILNNCLKKQPEEKCSRLMVTARIK